MYIMYVYIYIYRERERYTHTHMCLLWVSCVLTCFARISPEFPRKFIGSSPEFTGVSPQTKISNRGNH